MKAITNVLALLLAIVNTIFMLALYAVGIYCTYWVYCFVSSL